MKSNIFSPLPINDHTCGWTQALIVCEPKPALMGEYSADFVVVGAGYTGLSAARKFAEINPNAHMSDTGLQQYREKYALNKAGVDCVDQLSK